MKKKIIIFFALSALCIFSVNAQDVITLRNAGHIRARVTEITPTEIRYKHFDNLDGPVITLSRSEVFAITYENGRREVINPFTATESGASQARQNAGSTGSNRYAQQGNFAIGINALYATDGYDEIGIGGKLQYNVSNRIRFAGEYNFFPKKHIWSWWDFSVYGHCLLFLGDKFAVYPSVGLGVLGIRLIDDDISGQLGSGFVFSPGFGFDVSLTSNLIFNAEVRPKMGWVQRVNLVAGLAYCF